MARSPIASSRLGKGVAAQAEDAMSGGTSADLTSHRACIVHHPDGSGGIQSLPPRLMQCDADGDVADEFLVVCGGRLVQRWGLSV
jgi:hypothetical protein